VLASTITALCACAASGSDTRNDPKSAAGGKPVNAAQIFDQMLHATHERQVASPWNPKSSYSNPYLLLDVQVEDWYATPEAKFAHSIKIPNPVAEDSGYRPGMTQQEYFEHLCKTEAGEFIFKTVDNVEGIFQMRPRKIYSTAEWQHLYAIEDPYGYWPGEAEDTGYEFVSPRLYSYFEIPYKGRRIYGLEMKPYRDVSLYATPSPDARIARYFGNAGSDQRSMKVTFESQAQARYGFTWRGIKRPHDREMGIAGGELIVLDLQTQEVLGVRRGYVIWNRGWTGRVCPRYGYSGGQDKTTYFTTWFVAKVARPMRWQEFFADRDKHRIVPK